MKVWTFIHDNLLRQQPVLLLYVVDSQGSSPGRQGFKMAVHEAGGMSGSIGGGIMEHKLVEYARELLRKKDFRAFLKEQYHDKAHEADQSGMICSGRQTIAFVPILPEQRALIFRILEACRNKEEVHLSLRPEGLQLLPATEARRPGFIYESEEEWAYTEIPGRVPVIHILGGGHVGTALSEVMRMLGFYVVIYDDREGLNTLEANTFAHEKKVVDYQKTGELLPDDEAAFVVIMTFGYRPDLVIFRQLYNRRFFYLGMMGSHAKIEEMKREGRAYGITAEHWKKVHAPIGLNIYSKTPMEIAVSIAAEVIREKNRGLPTGRSQAMD
ncbi:MAG: XdhC family protein [Phaeodactylibacter sp.]|nr:XdhC family protein [Phaeodactylibacter sp.]